MYVFGSYVYLVFKARAHTLVPRVRRSDISVASLFTAGRTAFGDSLLYC